MNRTLRRSFLFLSILAIAAAAGLFWLYLQARAAEPTYSGVVNLPNLPAPVRVDFDRRAVPHVEAPDLPSLFFAQGYLVASERMWQMDLMRRLARGRLAEVLGEKALPADRLFRTLGLEQAARRNLEAVPAGIRAHLDAYADGVNAYIESARGRPPLEYRLAGFRPVPWEPLDSLSIGAFMVFSLSFNVREELMWLRLARRLGPERAAELFPVDAGLPAPNDAPDLPGYPVATLLDGYQELARDLALPIPGPASNAWAVAAERSASGHALLAGDPHLAPSAPGLWYELELKAPGYHVAGVTLPGTPFVLIGHNADLAWALTTVMADTQDLFLERVAGDGKTVRRADAAGEPIQTRHEAIRIKGRAEAEMLLVAASSHGVFIDRVTGNATDSPLDLPSAPPPWRLALRWNTEQPDHALEGMYRLNTARDLTQAMAAARLFRHASQNFLFAHRDGRVAWQISGEMPRRRGASGAFPQIGWTTGAGWDGYLPVTDNPNWIDPADGLLVSANNRSLPPDRAADLGHFWMPQFRAERIRDLLQGAGQPAANDMAAVQMDRISHEALGLIERLHRERTGILAADPDLGAALDSLLAWDGGMQADSAPATLYVLLREALYREIFGDELGADLDDFMRVSVESYNALHEALRSGRSSFWDDVGTPRKENATDILSRALERALNRLERAQGDWRTARLDRLRRLVFPHAFHDVPVLGALFDVGPVGVGGDNHTINVMKALPDAPETPAFVPTYRFLFTPGDWSKTRGCNALGQSGHRFSPHRRDQLNDWLAGGSHVWHWNAVPDGQRLGRLTLLPAQAVSAER